MEPVSDDELRVGARLWWVVMIVGLASIALGLILITRPFKSVAALAWFAGLFLLIGGISGFFGARRQEVGIGWAIVSVISGLVLLVWPDVTVQVVAVVAGIGYLLRGVIRAVVALMDHDESTMPLLVVGVIGALVGIAIIAWPDATVAVVGVVLGLGAIVAGIGEIVSSLELKRLAA